MSAPVPHQVQSFLDAFEHAVTEHRRVGSRETCDPAPVGSDEDWLVLLSCGIERVDAENCLDLNGWVRGGSLPRDGEPGEFSSFKKDDLNIILTHDPEFYHRFIVGTSICKRLNLMDRDDRVAVVKACREMEECEPRLKSFAVASIEDALA